MVKTSVLFGRRCRRRLAALAIAILGFVPIAGHASGVLSGRYAGTAVDSAIFNPPYGNFDGALIQGTFLIELGGCGSPEPAPIPDACLTTSAFLTADVPEQPSYFGVPNTLVRVENTPTTQRVSFLFGFNEPYSSARLELVGGANAFINGTDYSSLQAGTIDLAQSSLTLMGGRTYRADVALTSLTLDQASGIVPDAPTWGLLLIGFTMVGVTARLRQGKSGHALTA